MKLKYNQSSVTETIPLSTHKKQGKRLAIHHNGQNFYAPVVPTNDPKASNLPVGVNGEIFAVQAQEPPEVTAVNVAPSSVAVMQGQSATATVSAVGNDAVTGLSYGLSGAPTWITISDDLILIQPSDNDLGIANVQVYAQDTGSDAMSAAILRAEAKLRPIIQSLSVVPPAVTVQQGQSAVATVSAVANEAVTGLSYSLNGASSWLTLTDNSIIVAPTDNDLGSNTVDVIAYDTNSSASAATQFVATAALRPIISSVSVNPPTVAAAQGESTTATISAVANAAVTGLSYSLEGQPSWMNLSGSVILMTPTENDSGSAAVTVTAYDTGSTAHAETVFNAEAILLPKILTFTTLTDLSNVQITSEEFTTIQLQAQGNEAVSSIIYSSPNDNVYISSSPGYAGIKAPANLAVGESFTVTLIAQDDKGIASKTLPLTFQKYQKPTLTVNPNSFQLEHANSGNETIRATITSDSPGLLHGAGVVPNQVVSITLKDTLTSSTNTVTGEVVIVYSKKGSISSSTKTFDIMQDSAGFYTQKQTYLRLSGCSRSDPIVSKAAFERTIN